MENNNKEQEIKSKEEDRQIDAGLIAQWVINNRYPKNEQHKVSDHEMFHFLKENILKHSSQFSPSMVGWVKASERLPEKDAKYFVRYIRSGSRSFIWLSDLKQSPNVYEWLDESPQQTVGWMNDTMSETQLTIGRLEVNCFDEDSEMSIRVGQSRYQSLTVNEAKELANFIISHIKNETEANPESPQQINTGYPGEENK